MLILKKALCMLSPVWQLCRYSSVVEHVIGNDGVVSPILTIGTIFKNSAFIADFLFLNKRLFSPILKVLKTKIFYELSDF